MYKNLRTWSYIILRTEEEKEYAFEYAKKIAENFDAEKYLNAPRPYPTTLAQKMYGYAMPRQYTMLKNAPYVVIPVSEKVSFSAVMNDFLQAEDIVCHCVHPH